MADQEIPLTPFQLARYAKNGGHAAAWIVKSMAQELQIRRAWDKPGDPFMTTPAEQKLIIAWREMLASIA